MKATFLSTRLPAALALALVAGVALAPAAAGEPDVRPDIVAPKFIASQGEIDAVSLTIVDEKLALSLAVETHIQIELALFALGGIGHDGLKHFTEKKLHHYRQLFNTLEELTGGRAAKVLPRAARKTEGVVARDDSAPTVSNPSPAKRGRKVGVGEIVQNATANSILRVRLAIAQEYTHLMRAELEAALPEEFDQRYLSVEGFNQMQVLAMLRVFEQQASPEFARIIHLATVAAESHASEGRQLVEQIKTPPRPLANPGAVVNAADASGSTGSLKTPFDAE